MLSFNRIIKRPDPEALLLEKGLPLCVDLDGTLILGNSFWTLWKQKHRGFFPGGSWPMIKSLLAKQGNFSPQQLHYNRPLIRLLHSLSQKGLPLFLVTGANEVIAHKVAESLGVFTEAIGSTETYNLVGINKATYLKERFGIAHYTYIGDSWRDLPVWRWSSDILAISGNWPLSLYLYAFKKPSQSLLFFPPARSMSHVHC